MIPSIAEDIQMLVDFALDYFEGHDEINQMTKAAERVEAYLSSFKPDHL